MNVIDYLQNRGDLSFKVDPFNLVDNVVLCDLVYINFDNVLKEKEKFTIEELSMLIDDNFLNEVAKTERFKNAKASKYRSHISEDETKQFAAMQIDLSDGTTYIAFRGTDSTLIGWREDFQLSYKEIPSQIEAKNYINKTTSKLFRKYRVGGHSKGGALALYAAIKANPHLQKRIINVYSNDGPGILDEFYTDEEYEPIKDKFIKIVPEESIIGMLLEKSNDFHVVKSNAKGIMQHSLESWQIIGNKIVESNLSKQSETFQKKINDTLESISKIEREQAIKELFDVLNKAGYKKVRDFIDKGFSAGVFAINKILKINSRSKENINKLIRAYAESFTRIKVNRGKNDD